MDNRNFVLNEELFEQNAKVYQSRPLRAMRYQPGMENGWMLYMSNKPYDNKGGHSHAGVKFFDTKEDGMIYVEANEPEYIMIDGKMVECEVEYSLLRPVMYRKLAEGEERLGVDFCLGDYVLASDEQRYYDFYIMEDSTWIILDADGKIRVWEQDFLDSCNSTFFGNPEDFVYEKRVEAGKEEYIKIAI